MPCALGSHTDSPLPPLKHHARCSSPCPWLLSFTHLIIALHQLLPASCQSQRLLLCSCWQARSCSTCLSILLGSVLLQYDPQHHPSSLLVTTTTYVIDITGELTPTLLQPSCLVSMARSEETQSRLPEASVRKGGPTQRWMSWQSRLVP